MNNNKLDAILACRIEGTRLYGKPVQYIDVAKRTTILEYLVRYIVSLNIVDDICLAISQEKGNEIFADLAEKNGWKYTFGSPLDVLGRIVEAGKKIGTTHMLRVTSECPFMYTLGAKELFEEHVADNHDYSLFNKLPQGSRYEFIKMESLIKSHQLGNDRHRSELVPAFIYDNQSMFSLLMKDPPEYYQRPEVRITVDYPEDLTFCRRIYHDLAGDEKLVSIEEIINYWDAHLEIRKPVEQIGIDWGRGRLWE